MRIAIVSPYDPRPPEGSDPMALRGGVEEALDRCASMMAGRGHDVTVVASSTADGESFDPDGVRIVRVRRRGTVFRAPLAPLGKAIPADAEVVHVPATYPTLSDLVPLRERRRGRACVLDHHFDPYGPSATMRAATSAHRILMGRAMLTATRIVTKSRDYADHSPMLSRAPKARLDWVPNGVDVSEFTPGGARGDDLLCVGRLVPYKGVDVLIRAMPRIHRETGVALDVVGDGPEAARLRDLAERIGAPVRFHGRVPRAELIERYRRARLTVLPSVNSQEAFGIALLESMACGTPVVASDLPGVREVAALGGTTATPADPIRLAEAVVEALRHPEAFGAPAEIRERVVERYSWDSIADAWEGVYSRALEGAKA